MRRRIHDAKNAGARHFAARNRMRFRNSLIAMMFLTLSRLH
jgi:hypothetical protein